LFFFHNCHHFFFIYTGNFDVVFADFLSVFLQKIPKNFKKNSKNILFDNGLAQEISQEKQQKEMIYLQILLITSKLHIATTCVVSCFLLWRVSRPLKMCVIKRGWQSWIALFLLGT